MIRRPKLQRGAFETLVRLAGGRHEAGRWARSTGWGGQMRMSRCCLCAVALIWIVPTTGARAQVVRDLGAPAFTVGEMEGTPEEELYGVSQAFFLSDGSLVAVNQGSRELRFFDERGRFSHAAGRTGEGPGEFSFPRLAARIHGDTIAVWDAALHRVSFFSPSGAFSRSFGVGRPLPDSLTGGLGSPTPPSVLGFFGDGSVLVRPGTLTGDLTSGPNGIRQDSIPIIRIGPEGRVMEHLGVYPGDERHVHNRSSMRLPFGARFLIAVEDDRYWVSDGKDAEVHVFDRSGTVDYSLMLPVEGQRLTAETVDRYKTWMINRMVELARASTAEQLDAISYPEWTPRISVLEGGEDGDLWVRLYSPPGPDATGETWMALGRDGRTHGVFDFPEGHQLLDVAYGRLAVLSEDELGVERIQVYEVPGEGVRREGGAHDPD